MRFIYGVVMMCAILFLTSCATMPTQQELASADYGRYPDNYEQTIKTYLEPILKDPSSAQYRYLKGPEKKWTRIVTQSNYGYRVCYMINAKNSFGGFTGYKTHYFLIRDGVVVQHVYESGEKYDIMGEAAIDFCK